MANYDTIAGRITAANASASPGKIFLAGTNERFLGNIDINGNIQIGSGVVLGKVTHPPGAAYTGPSPARREYFHFGYAAAITVMPSITAFPPVGTSNITSTKTITPGSYGNIVLTGGQTITFPVLAYMCSIVLRTPGS